MRIVLLLCSLLLVASVATPAFALDAGPVDAGVMAADAGPEAAQPDPVADAEEDPFSVLGKLVKSAKEGNWRLVASLVLALMMVGLAKARDKVKWFSGDRGGAVLVMLLALGGALASALASDMALNFQLFLGAAGIAWASVGGYTWFKKLFWPSDKEE